jgi:hypothetical protein
MCSVSGKPFWKGIIRIATAIVFVALCACGQADNDGVVRALIYGYGADTKINEVSLNRYKIAMDNANIIAIETDGVDPELGHHIHAIYRFLSFCQKSECEEYSAYYGELN